MAKMVFHNYGGNYQLRINTPEELEHVLELEEARWVSTSAPIVGYNCDQAFLSFLDHDENGRVRSDELKEGIRWLFKMLNDKSHLIEETDTLFLADINTEHEEGRLLFAAAELILTNLNIVGADKITLSQVRDRKNIMSSAKNNGDGVIPPSVADDQETADFIKTVMDCVGSQKDAGGEDGLTEELLKTFVNESREFLSWEEKGRIPDGQSVTDIFPWGADTAGAWKLISSVEAKIDQYFTQCKLVRLDPRAAGRIRMSYDELNQAVYTDRGKMEEILQSAPLARPDSDITLKLNDEINPKFEKSISELKNKVLNKALNQDVSSLNEEQWNSVKSIFAAYGKWIADKKGATVEKLGGDKLNAMLQGPQMKKVAKLIKADKKVAEELNQVRNVEKLILYQKWMMEFANSFVSFPRLYDPNKRSLFEIGTLIIGGREMTFSVKVIDRKAHKEFAEKRNTYFLYLELTRREEKGEKLEVVTAVTSGDSYGLQIGKRGVFFTNDGLEWDARVVDIIENPISLWEAFKSPFQRAGAFLFKQVEKIGKAQQTKVESMIADPKGSTASRDFILAGSIGVAALGSSFAFIVTALSKVTFLHVIFVILGIIIIVAGPSLLIGYFKLRKRDLTTLVEAAGWAINIRMRLTSDLGRLFTHKPELPPDSLTEKRDLIPRFVRNIESNKFSWKRTLISAVIGFALLMVFVYFMSR